MVRNILENGRLHVDIFLVVNQDIQKDVLEQPIQKLDKYNYKKII